MTSVLTNLDSFMYEPGAVIVEENSKVTDLVVAASGKLNLYGFYTHRKNELKVLIVHLPEQSWYGDFQIMLNEESTF